MKEKKQTKGLTDSEVEKEIERLLKSDAVKLAKKKQRLEYRRRQYLYVLRGFEKVGKELMKAGITEEMLDEMFNQTESEEE